jgi:murein DD-endopeptidase MepM/ murein hydrolase activator NlpD
MRLFLALWFSVCTFIGVNSASAQSELKPIEVYYENLGNGTIRFYANNSNLAPVQTEVRFSQLENMNASVKLPHFQVLQAQQEQVFLFDISSKQPTKATSFKFSYVYQLGDPTKEPDHNYPYVFPYAHGQKFKVAQGYNGQLTHQNSNSLDFSLEIGDTVHAARAGKVTYVKQDSSIGGPKKELEHHANKIIILHDDGTFAYYVHLNKNGSLVQAGDQVEKGQAIGISGNTGYSFGPHLHFMVIKPTHLGQQTIPTVFHQFDGSIAAQEGKFYYSVHPDKAAFALISADAIDWAALKAQTTPSSLKNEIKIVTEKIDNHTLIYIDNGYPTTASGKITASVVNMQSPDGLSINFSVPPGSKKFIFYLTPIESSKQHQFQLSLSVRK